MARLRRVTLFLILLPFFTSGLPARAGVYAAPSVALGAYAFEPEASEPTPNFYGYAAKLGLGMSFAQIFDIGPFGAVLPGSLTRARIGKHDATLVSYGGEAKLRLFESVLFGVEGGASWLSLGLDEETERLSGQWRGRLFGVSVGALARLSKTSFFETVVEVTSSALEDQDARSRGSRRLDQVALNLTYAFVSAGGGSGASFSLFNDFLGSLGFF